MGLCCDGCSCVASVRILHLSFSQWVRVGAVWIDLPSVASLGWVFAAIGRGGLLTCVAVGFLHLVFYRWHRWRLGHSLLYPASLIGFLYGPSLRLMCAGVCGWVGYAGCWVAWFERVELALLRGWNQLDELSWMG